MDDIISVLLPSASMHEQLIDGGRASCTTRAAQQQQLTTTCLSSDTARHARAPGSRTWSWTVNGPETSPAVRTYTCM